MNETFSISRTNEGWALTVRGELQYFYDEKRKQRFDGELASSSLVEVFQSIVDRFGLPWIQMSVPRPEDCENESN